MYVSMHITGTRILARTWALRTSMHSRLIHEPDIRAQMYVQHSHDA